MLDADTVASAVYVLLPVAVAAGAEDALCSDEDGTLAAAG